MLLDKLIDKKGDKVTGWKVCRNVNGYPRLVKVTVPEDIPRVKTIHGKWRAKEVLVEEVYDCNVKNLDYSEGKKGQAGIVEIEKGEKKKVAHSMFANQFEGGQDKDYVKGKKTKADGYDGRRLVSCSAGIHFFDSEKSAIEFLKKSVYYPVYHPKDTFKLSKNQIHKILTYSNYNSI